MRSRSENGSKCGLLRKHRRNPAPDLLLKFRLFTADCAPRRWDLVLHTSRPVSEGEIFEDCGVPLRKSFLRQGGSIFVRNDETGTAASVDDLRRRVSFKHRLEKKPLRRGRWQRMWLVRFRIEKDGIVTTGEASELVRKSEANGHQALLIELRLRAPEPMYFARHDQVTPSADCHPNWAWATPLPSSSWLRSWLRQATIMPAATYEILQT